MTRTINSLSAEKQNYLQLAFCYRAGSRHFHLRRTIALISGPRRRRTSPFTELAIVEELNDSDLPPRARTWTFEASVRRIREAETAFYYCSEHRDIRQREVKIKLISKLSLIHEKVLGVARKHSFAFPHFASYHQDDSQRCYSCINRERKEKVFLLSNSGMCVAVHELKTRFPCPFVRGYARKRALAHNPLKVPKPIRL